MTGGWRSDSGRVVSRPGTGTSTTGAESGAIESCSSAGSPSSGAPLAGARSRSHVPELTGASRPEKAVPSTARRVGALPRRLAAAVSGTLALPLVRLTAPSGTASAALAGTRASAGAVRGGGGGAGGGGGGERGAGAGRWGSCGGGEGRRGRGAGRGGARGCGGRDHGRGAPMGDPDRVCARPRRSPRREQADDAPGAR